jgi:hypothetical protein
MQGRMGWLGYAGAAGALFLLTGCGIDWNAEYDDDGNPISTPDAQYAAVCMDQRTGNRLDDDACGDWDDDGVGHTAGTYFLWMPLNTGGYIPPVGGHLPANSPAVRTVPKGTPLAKGTPKTGGTAADIKRGGFGVKSGTAGGSKAGAAAGKAGSGSGGKSGGS